jgi:Tol biopolymer transport system component
MRVIISQLSLRFLITGLILALVSCGGDDVVAPGTGSIDIAVTTSGPEPDQDGYTLSIDEGAEVNIGVNATHRRDGLQPGSHSVRLGGMATNCAVQGDNPHAVSVTAGASATIDFAVSCSPTGGGAVGALEITTTTTGSPPDPDGYTVAVDNGAAQPIAVNATLRVPGLSPGAHQVTLAGIAANCRLDGGNPRAITVAAGATAAEGFSLTCSAGQPSASKIAFTSWPAGAKRGIYVVNPDGTELTRLSPDEFDDIRPTWSPDRTRIAFVYDFDLWVMDSDGQNRLRVSSTIRANTDPVWSSDGSLIAFETEEFFPCEEEEDRLCSLLQIWTVRPDGTGFRKVTDGSAPSWSPDGTRIAFHAENQIHMVNADGSDRRALTDQPRGAFEPAWSPDGTRIAFETPVQRAQEVVEIFVMNADGSNPRSLTDGRGADMEPLWSPDGRRVAFVTFDPSLEGTNHEVGVMNPDGSDRRVLTNNPASDAEPTWSPDGLRIAFMRKGANAWDLYLVNVDGSGERNLTNAPEITDDWPSWSPE